MRIECTLTQSPSGVWRARHESKDVGALEVQATSREEVIEKMRNEVRYRLELCPCTGESYQHIDLQVVDAPSR